MFGQRAPRPLTLEEVRRHARILVIDDQDWPAMLIFERDGYQIERWSEVKSLKPLIEGRYQLILLDINGVGLNESPDLQGLGILDAIKNANPAQAVIVYSAQKQKVSSSKYLERADAVIDKGASYVEFKNRVDQLLMSRGTPDYFISVMNHHLGESAALAPKAVAKALRAMRTGQTQGLER